MIRIPTEQRAAAMPTAAPVVPVMSGLVHGRDVARRQTDPCTRQPRHPWLHGQAFHPAPREILDVTRMSRSTLRPPGNSPAAFLVFGAEQAATMTTDTATQRQTTQREGRTEMHAIYQLPHPDASPAAVRQPAPRCADGNGTLTPLFFSDDVIDIARAKAICAKCPLAASCLSDALDREEPWGVWGGELLPTAASCATSARAGARPSTRARRSSSTSSAWSAPSPERPEPPGGAGPVTHRPGAARRARPPATGARPSVASPVWLRRPACAWRSLAAAVGRRSSRGRRRRLEPTPSAGDGDDDVVLDEPGEYVDPAARRTRRWPTDALPAVALVDAAGAAVALRDRRPADGRQPVVLARARRAPVSCRLRRRPRGGRRPRPLRRRQPATTRPPR